MHGELPTNCDTHNQKSTPSLWSSERYAPYQPHPRCDAFTWLALSTSPTPAICLLVHATSPAFRPTRSLLVLPDPASYSSSPSPPRLSLSLASSLLHTHPLPTTLSPSSPSSARDGPHRSSQSSPPALASSALPMLFPLLPCSPRRHV